MTPLQVLSPPWLHPKPYTRFRVLGSPTFGSLKGDLIERVWIPKGPQNPNSFRGNLQFNFYDPQWAKVDAGGFFNVFLGLG